MRTRRDILACMALWLALFAGPAPAADPTPVPAPAPAPAPAAPFSLKDLVYSVPPPGAPKSGIRLGGGTRNGSGDQLEVEVLLPRDHPGRTVAAQPILYWYTSRDIHEPVELAIYADQDRVLVESRLPGPFPAGVNALPLARLGASLEPGTVYRVVLVVRTDPARPQGALAAGSVLRVPAPAAGLPAGSFVQQSLALAGAGLWCDALQRLDPDTLPAAARREAHSWRAALLDLERLHQPAAHDRRRGAAPAVN